MLTVRPAMPEDIPAIMTVLEAAKGIMRASGNLHQWVGGYPSESVVREDIRGGYGLVVVERDRVVGYFAFIPSPEPTYATIYAGAWLDGNAPYHVIHRIGSLPDVHGVFATIMDFAFSRDRNIRIDTHHQNVIMRHALEKYGFCYCGIIYLQDGAERLAYQLVRQNSFT